MARLVYKPGFDKRLREIQGPRTLDAFARDSSVAASQMSRYGDPDGPRPRRGTLARIANAAYENPVNAEWLATGEGPMRGSRIPILDPILGRSTAGHQAAEPVASAQQVSLEIAGLRLTVIVEPVK